VAFAITTRVDQNRGGPNWNDVFFLPVFLHSTFSRVSLRNTKRNSTCFGPLFLVCSGRSYVVIVFKFPEIY